MHAGGVDHLDRPQAVRRQAVAPPEPGQPSAEQETDDGDVGVAAHQADQPAAVERLEHPTPLHPGTDPGDLRGRVDGQLVQGSGPHQDGSVEGPAGPVPAGLRRHGQAVGRAEAQHRLHVGDPGHLDDGGGLLVDGEQPGSADDVPAVVVRCDQPTGQVGTQ